MAFDYPVNLDLAGRAVTVFGAGPLAVGRVRRLIEVGADVTVVAAEASAEIDALDVRRVERVGGPEDLEGTFMAIITGEDAAPVAVLYEAANRCGVLIATVDDVEHSHFGAASEIRRGDLQLTISTAGRAPALSKRLRQELETTIDEAYGELVDVLHRSRERLLPRTVPFGTWAAAWGGALADLGELLELVRAGRMDEAEQRVVDRVELQL